MTDRVMVDLTRERVEKSPPVEADEPVMPPVPAPVAGDPPVAEMAARARASVEGDPSLRSARDVTGYYIAARDGDIGHDLLVDDRAWAIRYLVADTRNWWPGKIVVPSPEWIETVSRADPRVQVDLHREEIKAAPEYDSSRR